MFTHINAKKTRLKTNYSLMKKTTVLTVLLAHYIHIAAHSVCSTPIVDRNIALCSDRRYYTAMDKLHCTSFIQAYYTALQQVIQR